MADGASLQPLLQRAIEDADKETLVAVLKSMCASSTECILLATQRLLVTKNQEVQVISSDSEDGLEDDDEADDSSPDANPPSKKRKLESSMELVSRYATCKHCRQRFDVTANTNDACQMHDGELEVDEDHFPDDDDIQAGEHIDVETDWRVKEFPEGFIWTCCEENARSTPCVIRAHTATL